MSGDTALITCAVCGGTMDATNGSHRRCWTDSAITAHLWICDECQTRPDVRAICECESDGDRSDRTMSERQHDTTETQK